LEIYENLDLKDLDGEIWKIIDGYSDYYVSNLGRIKSFKCGKEIILPPNKDKDGYLRVNLCKNGEKHKTKGIHVLMYENHIGKIPKGYVVHHKDNTKNNFLDNFQMMTNEEHLRLHNKGENNPMYGKKRAGEKSGNHKLSNQDVIRIRIDLDEGTLTQKEIGEKFDVSQITISDIKLGRSWLHVK